MKRKWLFLFCTLTTMLILLAACAGTPGPAGEPGPPGPPGPEGPQGPAGEPGESPDPAEVANPEYVGTETCAGCHPAAAEAFMRSGHPWILTPVTDGAPPDFPFSNVPNPPRGYRWADISYVVGGYHWKARFLDQNGYIITGPPDGSAAEDYGSQYNLPNRLVDQNGRFVPFQAGEANLLYDCGGCHTTGYSSSGSQDDLPGIRGTWAQPGVQCEACHGPGGHHVQNPFIADMRIDRDAETCKTCHRMDNVLELEVENGFIQHHLEYGDLPQGKHAILDCVDCHDPHSGSVQFVQGGQAANSEAPGANLSQRCAQCHFREAQYQKGRIHINLNLTCAECHMPQMIQSAWGDAENFTADLRTHQVAIDPNQIAQFNEDGSLASGQLALNYACRHCHNGTRGLEKSDQQLIDLANDYHNPAAGALRTTPAAPGEVSPTVEGVPGGTEEPGGEETPAGEGTPAGAETPEGAETPAGAGTPTAGTTPAATTPTTPAP